MVREKILVIGNGFDLYHNKKTKYSDFLQFLNGIIKGTIVIENESSFNLKNLDYDNSSLLSLFINQYKHSVNNNNWIDMESWLKQFIHLIISFVDKENEERIINRSIGYSYSLGGTLPIEWKLIKNMSSFFTQTSPSSCCIKGDYIDYWGKINKEKILTKLECELDEICNYLIYYLQEYEPHNRESNVVPRKLFTDINPFKVVSFNYTNTYNELYGLDEKNIIYVHGDLKNKDIVLGYNDSNGDLEDLAFKKYYRRLIKNTRAVSDSYVSNGLGGRIAPETYFFGHSLDISDEDILKNLICISDSVCIFYTDYDDKRNKIGNLIKLLEKQEAIAWLQNKKIRFEAIPD